MVAATWWGTVFAFYDNATTFVRIFSSEVVNLVPVQPVPLRVIHFTVSEAPAIFDRHRSRARNVASRA